MICENDYDCEGRQVCYSDVEWLSELPSANVTNCHCYGYFGWEGSDCLELGIQSRFWIGCHAVLLFTIAPFTLYFGFQGISYIIALRGNLLRLRPIIGTYLAAMISLLARIFTSIVFILNVVNSKHFGQSFGDGSNSYYTSQKRGKYDVEQLVGQVVTIVFAVHAGLNVGLVWTKTAYNSKNMTQQTSKEVTRFNLLMRILQALYVIGLVCLFIFDHSNLLTQGFVFCLLLFGIYLMAHRWFRPLFRLYSGDLSQSTNLQKAIMNIKRSSTILIGVYACLLLTIIPVVVLVLTVNGDVYPDAQRELMKPGEINGYSVLFMLIWTFISCSSATIIWYVSSVLKDYSTSDSSRIENSTSKLTSLGSSTLPTSTSTPSVSATFARSSKLSI